MYLDLNKTSSTVQLWCNIQIPEKSPNLASNTDPVTKPFLDKLVVMLLVSFSGNYEKNWGAFCTTTESFKTVIVWCIKHSKIKNILLVFMNYEFWILNPSEAVRIYFARVVFPYHIIPPVLLRIFAHISYILCFGHHAIPLLVCWLAV